METFHGLLVIQKEFLMVIITIALIAFLVLQILVIAGSVEVKAGEGSFSITTPDTPVIDPVKPVEPTEETTDPVEPAEETKEPVQPTEEETKPTEPTDEKTESKEEAA